MNEAQKLACLRFGEAAVAYERAKASLFGIKPDHVDFDSLHATAATASREFYAARFAFERAAARP